MVQASVGTRALRLTLAIVLAQEHWCQAAFVPAKLDWEDRGLLGRQGVGGLVGMPAWAWDGAGM